MRILLAIAVLLALGMQANAQDIDKKCAAEARAKGLFCQERMHFEARCKAAAAATWPSPPALVVVNPKVINANGELGRDQHNGHYSHCLSNSAILGACPVCVIFSWFVEDDSRCYVY
jgi:hypothetical protein